MVLEHEPPDRTGLGLFLSSTGWFSHFGGAFGFFSAVLGSLEGGRGVVALTRGEATPAFFERLTATARGRDWEGVCT